MPLCTRSYVPCCCLITREIQFDLDKIITTIPPPKKRLYSKKNIPQAIWEKQQKTGIKKKKNTGRILVDSELFLLCFNTEEMRNLQGKGTEKRMMKSLIKNISN